MDEQTDRLFLFTLAGISGLNNAPTKLESVCYTISHMEDTWDERIDERELSEWKARSCYHRFARSDGGVVRVYLACF